MSGAVRSSYSARRRATAASLSSSRWISARAVAGRRARRPWAGCCRRGRWPGSVGHQRRPESRRSSSSRGTSTLNTNDVAGDVAAAPCARSPPPGAACAGSRRGCSRARSRAAQPLADDARSSRSSGTSPPFSMSGPACWPSGVPAAMASRSMSPVEMRGTPRCAASRAACVPFPAPGGPRKMTRGRAPARALRASVGHGSSGPCPAREAVVVAHDELRLDLGDGVHGHAHDDQQRGAAEVEVEAQAFRDPAQVVVGQEGVERRARCTGMGATLKPVIRNSGRSAMRAR